jgi:integrase
MAALIQLPQTSKWAKRENQPPIRQPNQASRTREYLTPDEVERMITAARRGGGRLAERDALLIIMAHRHGIRASELIALAMGPDRPKGGHASRRETEARLAVDASATRPRASSVVRAWKRQQGDATPYVVHVTPGRPHDKTHGASRGRESR